MQYGEVSGIDVPVSRLVQGTMMVGEENAEEGFRLYDAVFAMGCTAFDTAHVYGGGACQRALGAWINDRGIRDRVVVIDKGAHPNADRRRVTDFDVASDLHDCLARLKTDYIDLFLLHRDDPDVPVGPIVEALNEHLRAGRIRAFGGSNWTHERLEEANEYAAAHGLEPFVASSPHFSLADQLEAPWEGCVSISGPSRAAARAWYEANQMPVFSWSSLSRGFLSGRYTQRDFESWPEEADESVVRCYYCEDNLRRLERARGLAKQKGLTVPQVALAYLFAQPVNAFALVGSETADEFRANAEAMSVELTEEELGWLDLVIDPS